MAVENELFRQKNKLADVAGEMSDQGELKENSLDYKQGDGEVRVATFDHAVESSQKNGPSHPTEDRSIMGSVRGDDSTIGGATEASSGERRSRNGKRVEGKVLRSRSSSRDAMKSVRERQHRSQGSRANPGLSKSPVAGRRGRSDGAGASSLAMVNGKKDDFVATGMRASSELRTSSHGTDSLGCSRHSQEKPPRGAGDLQSSRHSQGRQRKGSDELRKSSHSGGDRVKERKLSDELRISTHSQLSFNSHHGSEELKTSSHDKASAPGATQQEPGNQLSSSGHSHRSPPEKRKVSRRSSDISKGSRAESAVSSGPRRHIREKSVERPKYASSSRDLTSSGHREEHRRRSSSTDRRRSRSKDPSGTSRSKSQERPRSQSQERRRKRREEGQAKRSTRLLTVDTDHAVPCSTNVPPCEENGSEAKDTPTTSNTLPLQSDPKSHAMVKGGGDVHPLKQVRDSKADSPDKKVRSSDEKSERTHLHIEKPRTQRSHSRDRSRDRSRRDRSSKSLEPSSRTGDSARRGRHPSSRALLQGTVDEESSRGKSIHVQQPAGEEIHSTGNQNSSKIETPPTLEPPDVGMEALSPISEALVEETPKHREKERISDVPSAAPLAESEVSRPRPQVVFHGVEEDKTDNTVDIVVGINPALTLLEHLGLDGEIGIPANEELFTSGFQSVSKANSPNLKTNETVGKVEEEGNYVGDDEVAAVTETAKAATSSNKVVTKKPAPKERSVTRQRSNDSAASELLDFLGTNYTDLVSKESTTAAPNVAQVAEKQPKDSVDFFTGSDDVTSIVPSVKSKEVNAVGLASDKLGQHVHKKKGRASLSSDGGEDESVTQSTIADKEKQMERRARRLARRRKQEDAISEGKEATVVCDSLMEFMDKANATKQPSLEPPSLAGDTKARSKVRRSALPASQKQPTLNPPSVVGSPVKNSKRNRVIRRVTRKEVDDSDAMKSLAPPSLAPPSLAPPSMCGTRIARVKKQKDDPSEAESAVSGEDPRRKVSRKDIRQAKKFSVLDDDDHEDEEDVKALEDLVSESTAPKVMRKVDESSEAGTDTLEEDQRRKVTRTEVRQAKKFAMLDDDDTDDENEVVAMEGLAATSSHGKPRRGLGGLMSTAQNAVSALERTTMLVAKKASSTRNIFG